MHSVVYVAVSSTKRWCSYSYAFTESSYGNIVMAGQRIPMHAFGNDKSLCAVWLRVVYRIEIQYDFRYIFLLGYLRSHIGPLLALRRRIDCANYREYTVRTRFGRSNEWDDAKISWFNGYFSATPWCLRVGRDLAKGKNSVSAINSNDIRLIFV